MTKNIEVQYKPLDDLTPADYNPRIDLQEGDADFEKLKRSIKEFGFIDPIIYNELTGRIVGGHQRWKAAKSLGMETVPVVTIDLTEDEEKVLNIGLNKIGGDFDEEKLGALLSELEMGDTDLTLTGFDDFEIDGLITALQMNQENSMGDLDEFLEGDEVEGGGETEAPDDEGFEVPEGFVKYQVACTIEEREQIVKAVKLAKEQTGVATSNEALAFIAQFFLNAGNENE